MAPAPNPDPDAPEVVPEPSPRRTVSRETVLLGLLALGGLVATFYLLVTQAELGPLLVVVVGGVLVWPLREVRAARPVLLALGVVAAAHLFTQLGGVLAPFAVVFLLAYLLDPAVAWAARRWGVPRWASAAVLTLAALGAAVTAGVFLVPALLGQAEVLLTSASELILRLPTWVEQSAVLDGAEQAGLVDRDALVSELATFVPSQIQAAAERIPAIVTGLVRQIGTVLGTVMTAALLPVLLFYMLKDFPTLRDGLVSVLPRYRGRREYLARAGSVFGSYVRGLLVISAASAVIVAVPLFLLGVPYSLVLGLLAGLLNMIPSVGSILTYILGVSLMLVFGTWTDVLIVLAVLAGQAVIEQAFLTPNVMGQQVGVHPVVVLVALFVFGALFGLLGVLLAVPAAALVAGFVRASREALVLDLADPDTEEPLVA